MSTTIELKPRREWFEELPEGIRELALEHGRYLEQHCLRSKAIIGMGLWYLTPQGKSFWRDVHFAWTGQALGIDRKYPEIPGAKPKVPKARDLRYTVGFYRESQGYHWTGWVWELGDTRGNLVATSPQYSRKSDAKRGLLRFLKRLGVGPEAVRWNS